MADEQEKKPSWEKRRRMMYIIIAFCMGCIIWLLYTGADTKVAETAVLMSFLIIGSTVGSYVFGAAWQDVKR